MFDVTLFTPATLMLKTIRGQNKTFGTPKKTLKEDDKQFYSRIHDVSSRCSNLFSSKEVIDMYNDGMSPSIDSLVLRFPDTYEGCAYMEVV